VKPLNALNLATELKGMEGRQLRMRAITIESKGVLALHDHVERPAVDYVVQGAVDHRGNEMNEYVAGTSISENTKVVHWIENRGTTPAVVVAVDIFKQP
jgi:quercetin dioxygenase-like cupin family protein